MESKDILEKGLELSKDLKCKSDELNKKLSVVEQKQQDILHYIESKNLSSVSAFNAYKELKSIREERRKVKNEMVYISLIKDSLFSKDIEKKIQNQNKKVKNPYYGNRIYNQKTLDNIIVARRGKENG